MADLRHRLRATTASRLTLAAAVVIAIVLAAASFGTVAALRQSLLSSIDRSARDDAVDVAAQLGQGGDAAAVATPEPDAVVQVLDASGAVVGGSANAPSRALVPPDATTRRHVTVTGPLPIAGSADGYRIASLRTADGRTVLVALPGDDVTDAVHHLETVLLIGAPALFVVLVVLAWAVVRRALAPVEAMHGRQRAFVADAAHELRTPLSGLRVQLEVAQSEPAAAAAARLPALATQVHRLSDTVEALLALARVDDRQLASADVDLDDVVLGAVRVVAADSDVRVDAAGVGAARVRGDRAALSRLVDNLLSNAVRHARSTVCVSLEVDHRDAVLSVSDDGPGVPADDRERVFERFTRLDCARTRIDGGVGLGLAIVRAVARAHGGDVRVADGVVGGRFVVRIPCIGVPTSGSS